MLTDSARKKLVVLRSIEFETMSGRNWGNLEDISLYDEVEMTQYSMEQHKTMSDYLEKTQIAHEHKRLSLGHVYSAKKARGVEKAGPARPRGQKRASAR